MPTSGCRVAAVLILAGAPGLRAQSPVDSGLARYIAGIRAIDNHAHPMRPVPRGAPPDTEFDALPLDGIPSFPIPWRLTLESPVWASAARALYGNAAQDSVAGARAGARARVLARMVLRENAVKLYHLGPPLAP